MQPSLRRISRTLIRCLVCGSSEVRTDEVIERGVVFLAECPRCEHRWTEHAPPARPGAVRRAEGASEEVATAA